MMKNPFDVTKAVDYTDSELYKYWVDLDSEKGFSIMMKPTTLMPMIILGSKGSGKTHIMKYFSYELQKIRCEAESNSIPEGLAKEKFIGVFIRCTSFNAESLSGNGVSEQIWSAIHAYLWELWVGERICGILTELKAMGVISDNEESIIVSETLSLFHEPESGIESISGLHDYFFELQKSLIYNCKNFVFDGLDKPDVKIKLNISQITYGLPQILKDKVSFFKNKYILYLIDEMENFSSSQQKLIQSLIREKPNACTFRIGARPYGIKHYNTLNGEENHDGSEFEKLVLDEFLRNYENYDRYIIEILNSRVLKSGLSLSKDFNIESMIECQTNADLVSKIFSKKDSVSRRALVKLESRLNTNKVLGLNESDVRKIIELLSFDDDHVIERANVMLMYRALKGKINENLLTIAQKIHDSAVVYHQTKAKDTEQGKILNYYRQDLIDSMARDAGLHPLYNGLERLIELSCGTPRTILRLLKSAFISQYFNTSKFPFEDGRVLTIKSQRIGVEETYEWFFEEHRIPASGQNRPADSIDRLGDYLRDLRFSEVPPQCSISIFSLDVSALSPAARENLETLVKYSYLIRSVDRRKKNSHDLLHVYTLNSILLPKWELALAKRGNVQLSAKDAEYIFNPERPKDYDSYFKTKMTKYKYPFKKDTDNQDLFFELPLF